LRGIIAKGYYHYSCMKKKEGRRFCLTQLGGTGKKKWHHIYSYFNEREEGKRKTKGTYFVRRSALSDANITPDSNASLTRVYRKKKIPSRMGGR